MTGRSLGHRAPLLWLVLPLMAGLAAGKAGDWAPVPWLLAGALGAAVLTVVASWRAPRWWAAALAVAMFLAGSAGYALHRARLPVWDALPPREARLSLRVDRVFSQIEPNRVAGLATVVSTEEHLRDLAGQRVYFALTLGKGDAVPVRSAVVSTVGVIVTLSRNPPADSFDGYLAGTGINFRLTRGRVVAEEKAANAYYRFCARAAERFRVILSQGIAQKRPELAGLLRVPAWPRFVTGAALLWLFVDITGASPSAVRAFVMAVFFQAAFVLRRPGNPLAALVASALAVLLVAPLQVFSASFLMSYGIVTALLVLGLPLGEAWLARWTPWRDVPEATWSWWQGAAAEAWPWIATAVAIGVATTLVSVITGVQFFRLLTPGALFANLALIPAAMLVTLGGFASLMCGLAGWAGGAALCNHASALVLLGVEWTVRLSVQVKGAFVPAHFSTPWMGGAALGVLTVALLAGYAAGWRKARGGWWPPFAVVAVALIFGVKFD